MKLARLFVIVVALVVLEAAAAAGAVVHLSAVHDEAGRAEARSRDVLVACERLSGLAHREVAVLLGYLQGAVTVDDLFEARADMEKELDVLEAMVEPGSGLGESVAQARDIQDRLFRNTATGSTLQGLVREIQMARENILEKNAKHQVRVQGIMDTFGDHELNETLVGVLLLIERERVAILEFGQTVGANETQARAREAEAFALNDRIVAALSRLAADGLAETAAAARGLQVSDAHNAEGFAEVAEDLDRLAVDVRAVSAASAEEATKALFERVDANLTRASTLGVHVPRGTVPLVGEDVTKAAAFGSVITCQQSLREGATRFFAGSFALDENVRGTLTVDAATLRGIADVARDRAVLEVEALEERKADAARASLRLILGILAASVALTVGGGLFVARRFARRVEALQIAAEAVRQGRLDGAPLAMKGDEFDPLIAGFDHMTAAIAEREQQLSRLARFPAESPNPIFEADPTGEIRYANPAAEAAFPDLADQGARHPVVRAALDRATLDAGAQCTRFEVDVDGKVYDVFGWSTGGRSGIKVYANDVTIQRRAMDRLNRSLAREELIVDMLSHDVKNQLALAAPYLDLLVHKEPARARELQPTIDALDRAQDILDKTLQFLRVESGAGAKGGDVDLVALVAEACAAVGPLASACGVVLAPAPGLPTVPANPLLQRALENLLSNAVKWSPRGAHVEVHGQRIGARCRIRVVDHGPGIPAADKAGLFQRFVRVDRHGVKGTGLGLAIVSRILETVEGRVWYEDTPGGGATAVVEFPIAVGEAASAQGGNAMTH